MMNLPVASIDPAAVDHDHGVLHRRGSSAIDERGTANHGDRFGDRRKNGGL
jgi:hypothetical protein